MSQRFIRCKHCGLPHTLDTRTCPMTGRAVELPKAKAVPSAPPPAPGTFQHEVVPRAAAVPRGVRLEGMLLDGKYRILQRIGRGGMGAVYLGEHVHLERRVAVKVLLKGHDPGSEAVKRFYREAQIAGRLGHPNIVEVYDLGTLEDGAPFIVMEYLEGETLGEKIARDGALPIDVTLMVMREVLSALEAAHARGVVHRDLKPANVFLAQESRGALTASAEKRRDVLGASVRLLDFGISKVTDEGSLAITRTGKVVGTPYYMAPEQARGNQVDHRIDIYAAGVVMYEALTGRLPFKANNYSALVVKILDATPEPPSTWRPSLWPALDDLVMKALAKSALHRFQSAGEMLKAVEGASAPARRRFLPPRDPSVDAKLEDDPTDVSDTFVKQMSRREKT